MKILFSSFIFCALVIFSNPVQAADWNVLKGPQAQTLRSITMSGKNLVAVGNSGGIFYSSDDGITWTQSAKSFSGWFYSVKDISDGTLFAVGDSGVGMKSLDHGVTWSSVGLGVSQNLSAISSRGTTSYIVGANGTLIRLSNAAWTVVPLDATLDFFGVEDIGNNDTAWIVGAEGKIMKLTQKGLSQATVLSNTNETLRAVHFISSTVGFIVGTNGVILKTTNGGTSWGAISISGVTNQTLYAIASSDAHVVIVGDQLLITSDDSGTTWNVKAINGTSKTFYDAAFTNASDVLAVGSDYDASSLLYHLSFANEASIPLPDVAPSNDPSPGALIKLSCNALSKSDDPCRTVYFYATDGKRHAFSNDKVYFSWFTDFSTVKEVNATFLSSLTLGKNVTYRPGVKMVKFQTSPTVYAVAKGGVLRAIKTEKIAETLYGSDWNKQIDDISDVFWNNYTIGEPINLASDYDVIANKVWVGGLSENF